MPKFEVQIFGTVPDCLEIEADDADSASLKAIEEVLDRLDFVAAEADQVTGCAKPKGKSDGVRKH